MATNFPAHEIRDEVSLYGGPGTGGGSDCVAILEAAFESAGAPGDGGDFLLCGDHDSGVADA